MQTTINKTIASLIKTSYQLSDIENIFSILKSKGTFDFPILKNGLFPAATNLNQQTGYTGYDNIWIRDNIFIAYSHYLNNHTSIALRNINTLTQYFIKYKWRFENIIAGKTDYNDPMNRPHIRFKGTNISEIKQKWAHAQNDALGYFLWFFCKMHYELNIDLTPEEKKLLSLFVLYFYTIRYWQDADSGHWEENRKISASSIGVVVGALREMNALMQKEKNKSLNYQNKLINTDFIDDLIKSGVEVLRDILPAECIIPERRYDAALLFIIFPLHVIEEEMEDTIISDVVNHLSGEYGIRRYIGDSYWSADYKKKLKPELRCADFSDKITLRDELLEKGQEAQWCIFDPILSVIHGIKYKKKNDIVDLHKQVHHFNRSLLQLTKEDNLAGGFKCPELYYLEDGKYVPNDIVPLLWTQANLWMSFKFMQNSLVDDASNLLSC